jgi:putative intracellular protease/amidase
MMNDPNTIFLDCYMENLIKELIQKEKKSSAEIYDSALKQMRMCFGKQGIPLSKVIPQWVRKLKKHLINNGLSANSVNTYLGAIRSTYNRAVLTYDVRCVCRRPFEGAILITKQPDKVVPGMDILNRIRFAQLDDHQAYLKFSRDLFLFSYYAGGMSFRDMAFLEKKNIQKGYLYFRRSRSGSEYVVFITEPMKAIIRDYQGFGTYLFPIILKPDIDLYKQYRSNLRKYNIHLCKLAILLRIKMPLNTPMMFDKKIENKHLFLSSTFMEKKKIVIFLFNGFSDWEIAYLAPEIKKSEVFDLFYFSKDGKPVSSMGGVRILPDLSLSEIKVEDVDLMILPGGVAWENGESQGIDLLTKNLFEEGKTIAAICAATTYLGKLGLLDHLKHTSNDLSYLKAMVPHYSGERNYVNLLAVTDKNIITANGIAPIEFSKEIFEKIELHSKQDIEKWFQLFKNGVWSE